jgi:protein-tyrosine-phosphatase
MPVVSTLEPPDFLKLLGHELRWKLLVALARSDYRVQELVTQLGKPLNLVSYHLRLLREATLLHEHRSSADGRDVYYSLDLDHLRTLYQSAALDLHPALGSPAAAPARETAPAAPTRVLFLCTHNSARSQLAEAALRQLGDASVVGASAGTQPASVHPATLSLLAERGIDASGLRAKHLAEFAGQTFDYIVTVCDRARETCPIFPGDPELIHWSFADPAAIVDPALQQHAFAQTLRELQTRIRYLLTVIERKRKEQS